MQRSRFFLAIVLSGALFGAQAGPTLAYTVVSETGLHGSYTLNESSGDPAATCGYGKMIPPDFAWFHWLRLRPPTVFAADRIAGQRDHRQVSWQFKLQGRVRDTGTWQTLAKSNLQKATAYDDAAAPFSAMKVYKNARYISYGADPFLYTLRALVIIRWYKPSGAVEGTVKLTPTYYRLKMPWGTATGGSDWCSAEASAG